MRSVLITGASTGIGRAAVRRFDADGWRVFAGVRRESDARALLEEGSTNLRPLLLDVTDAAQIAAGAEAVRAEPGGLQGLVNNAGVAVPGPLEVLPIEDFRQQIEVNLTGQVAVTQALLPAVRRGRGRIVFISSIGGRLALPLTGAYHAAKFGIEAVGDVFRQELRLWDIPVSIVEPGSIDTPIWERGERRGDEMLAGTPSAEVLYGSMFEGYRKQIRRTAERGVPPDEAAKAIEHALTARRPRTRYLVGSDARVGARLKPFVPTRLFDWVVARTMSR